MSRKKINIGLFGFGCVGFGLYEVLTKTSGLKAEIKKICVKDKHKQRPIDASHFTFDKEELLNDEHINVIVELIDDADAAFEIVSAALRKGKAVVSANKKLIAEHFEELLALQKEYNAPFLYEAAVCASIPIIRNLEEYYDNDLLKSIVGIVNGSTNYILTQTFSENLSYEEALRQAQAKGYAESNPTLDTGGFDAKFKLLILLAHAFGIVAKPQDLFHYGIENIGDPELRYAREKNLKIKLTAHAYRNENGKITAFVLPQFIKPSENLFKVDEVYNAVQTKTSFADTQFFMGKGAGAHPTASAVLSDLSALTYDYRYEYKKLNPTECLESAENIWLKVYFRHEKQYAEFFKTYFYEIEETYQNAQTGYFTGIISLAQIQKIQQIQNLEPSFILIEPIHANHLSRAKKAVLPVEVVDY
ncbi:MAG: homoserine dehydrogenase [Bacteroidia bacterium]